MAQVAAPTWATEPTTAVAESDETDCFDASRNNASPSIVGRQGSYILSIVSIVGMKCWKVVPVHLQRIAELSGCHRACLYNLDALPFS